MKQNGIKYIDFSIIQSDLSYTIGSLKLMLL